MLQLITPTQQAIHARRQAFRAGIEQTARAREYQQRIVAILHKPAANEVPVKVITPYKFKRTYPHMDDLAQVVMDFFHVSKMDLQSSRRSVEVTHPRQCFCWLAKNLTPASLVQIGAYLGGRDHTTVLHAVRRIDALIEMNLAASEQMETLRALAKERFEERSGSSHVCYDSWEV